MFTPTQRRIMDILLDGLPHTAESLLPCLNDSQSTVINLAPHLTAIRRRLRPTGCDVSCHRVSNRTYYQYVRLMASPYSGSR